MSPSTNEMVIVFRGTNTQKQLIQEGVMGMKPNEEFYGHGQVIIRDNGTILF